MMITLKNEKKIERQITKPLKNKSIETDIFLKSQGTKLPKLFCKLFEH